MGRQKEGGATADNSGPATCVYSPLNDTVAYNTNCTDQQARNGPAPLHLLVDHRRCRCTRVSGKVCGCVPTVVSFQKNGSTFVGVRNPPWGFGSQLREFLGGTKAAERHRLKLRDDLRALAWAEHDRRVRLGGPR